MLWDKGKGRNAIDVIFSSSFLEFYCFLCPSGALHVYFGIFW